MALGTVRRAVVAGLVVAVVRAAPVNGRTAVAHEERAEAGDLQRGKQDQQTGNEEHEPLDDGTGAATRSFSVDRSSFYRASHWPHETVPQFDSVVLVTTSSRESSARW